MKLESVRVKNFRCIDDSGEFKVGQVTCLVGKNESGKTSLLHALAKLNSTDTNLSNFDKERDYPRKILTDYKPDTEVLETKWLLSDEDVSAVENILGPDCFSTKIFTIIKLYQVDGSICQPAVDEGKVVEWLLSEAGCDATERQQFEGCVTVKELLMKAEPLKAASPRISTMTGKIAQWQSGNPNLAAINILLARLPKFLYFASYDRMNGNVSLETLRNLVTQNPANLSKGDSVFLAFLDFAGTPLDEISKLDRYESMKARLNLYGYVRNDPIDYIDQFGLEKGAELLMRMNNGYGGLNSFFGKIWNAPNTAIGLVWGGLGIPFGAKPDFGNNALQFENHPYMTEGDITIGNIICYNKFAGPNVEMDDQAPYLYGDHERQHTYQGEQLGLLYLPANFVGGITSILTTGSWHGNNFMERGPLSVPPTPWPIRRMR